MKVIQTIKSIKRPRWAWEVDTFKSLILSVALAKKYQGDIVLYTDEKTKKFFKKYKLPYNKINTTLLSDFDNTTYQAAKFLSWSIQDDTFIHLDHDLFLLSQIPSHNEIVFGYPNTKRIINNEIRNDRIERLEEYIETYETYIKLLLENPNVIDANIKKGIKWNYIPSLSIFGGKDFETISSVSKKLWEIYEFQLPTWDSSYSGGKILEQLVCPSLIALENDKYFSSLSYEKIRSGNSKVTQMGNTYPFTCDAEETIINGSLYGTKELLNDNKKFDKVIDDIYNTGWFHPSSGSSTPLARKIINRLINDIKEQFNFLQYIEKKIPYIFSDRDIFSKSYLIY